jgi:hypothetical protein
MLNYTQNHHKTQIIHTWYEPRGFNKKTLQNSSKQENAHTISIKKGLINIIKLTISRAQH